MTIPLVTGVDPVTNNPYSVNIIVDEDIANLYWRTENAEVLCTCSSFRDDKTCTHIKQNHGGFARWQNAQLRRLRKTLIGGTPVEVLANSISERIGFPIEMAQLIKLPEGKIAVQWDAGLAVRYSHGCGWGTMGKQVYLQNGTGEHGALYLLAQEMDFDTLTPDELVEALDFNLPPLPPDVFSIESVGATETKKGVDPLYNQSSGIIVLGDVEEKEVVIEGEGDSWARFWACLAGLRLVDQGWSSVQRYLPDSLIDGKKIGALAIDVEKQQMRAIPSSGLSVFSEGVPSEYINKIGHTHLPWGDSGEDTSHAQVIVRHPIRQKLSKDDSVLALSTNLWQGEEAHPVVEQMLAHVAAVLVRLGHKTDNFLYYGDQSWPLNILASKAIVSSDGGAWSLTSYAWTSLKDMIVPEVLSGNPIPESAHTLSGGDDWMNILPTIEDVPSTTTS